MKVRKGQWIWHDLVNERHENVLEETRNSQRTNKITVGTQTSIFLVLTKIKEDRTSHIKYPWGREEGVHGAGEMNPAVCENDGSFAHVSALHEAQGNIRMFSMGK